MDLQLLDEHSEDRTQRSDDAVSSATRKLIFPIEITVKYELL